MIDIEVTVVDSQSGEKSKESEQKETINVDHINNYRKWGIKGNDGEFIAVWLSNNKRIVVKMSVSEFKDLIIKAKENG